MVLGLYLNVCGIYCKNPWYYRVCEDYNGIVSKILCDEWVNPRILSVQSLEAHQHRLSVQNHQLLTIIRPTSPKVSELDQSLASTD